MADRNQRGVGQARLQQLVERGFRCLVERGGRLVEEQIVGRLEERAGDAKPLLFAEREHAVPVRILVEPLGQRRQADGTQRFGNLFAR